MIFIYLIASLLASPRDAQVLADFGHSCSFLGSPADHLAAASAVGAVYHVDPSLLLAIAGHESCFSNDVVTGHCSGVMQTVGAKPASLLDGYERGAIELRAWITWAKGDLRVALAGYSGGVRVARGCRDGGSCSYADLFLARAKLLYKALRHPGVL